MSGRYLLDTNAIINAINRQARLPSNLYAISVITKLELLSWPSLDEEDERQLNRVIQKFPVVELERPIQDAAIKIRKTTGLKLPDSIISATAIVGGFVLVTDDEKLGNRHIGSTLPLAGLIS